MILIKSRFRYYHTLLGVEIEKNKVYAKRGELKPFCINGRNDIYYRVDGKPVALKKLLNSKYLVAIIERRKLPDWCY